MFKKGFSYDDVLMKPRESNIRSRSQVSLAVKLSKGISLGNPFIPANMKTVMNKNIISIMSQNHGMTLMHRFESKEEQLKTAQYIVEQGYENYAGMSIGVKPSDYKMVEEFAKIGIKIICIDIAHGHSVSCLEMCEFISKNYPDVLLIAGNVATGEGARSLWLAGADVVKCGIGAGSICLTRIETGSGSPQLTAIMDAWEEKKKLEASSKFNKEIFLIADGGLTNTGNCAKALAFSDMVMAGNLFAATDESPGEIVELDGIRYKHYDGSSTHKDTHVEGVRALKECKGPMQNVLDRMKQGVSSALSYQGVDNLTEFKKVVEFIEVSPIAQRENGAHDVRVVG